MEPIKKKLDLSILKLEETQNKDTIIQRRGRGTYQDCTTIYKPAESDGLTYGNRTVVERNPNGGKTITHYRNGDIISFSRPDKKSTLELVKYKSERNNVLFEKGFTLEIGKDGIKDIENMHPKARTAILEFLQKQCFDLLKCKKI